MLVHVTAFENSVALAVDCSAADVALAVVAATWVVPHFDGDANPVDAVSE